MTYTMDDLLKIMEALRGPKGCPWDKAQTLETLKPYLIEEAYEVLEAIENQDFQAHKEELGDLLLQIVFHAQLAKELEKFTFQDIVQGICTKLIQRHPHVFGEDQLQTPEAVLQAWERRKVSEDNQQPFQGIPKHLPALLKAWRLGMKASNFGFDWENTTGVLEKLEEELEEFHRAHKEGDKEGMAHELGDLLFVIANVARHLGYNPEDLLQKANQRFQARFLRVFKKLKEEGKAMEACSMEELDRLWEESKKAD